MRLALLSSYTTNFLSDKLKFFLSKEFNKVEIYNSPFNQYPQDILNKKSPFYSFSPEIVIFLFDDQTWIENHDQLFKLIKTSKKRLPNSFFLIGNITKFQSQILPSLEWNTKNSLTEQIAKCNITLAKLCQTQKQLFLADINELVQFYGRSTMMDKRMQYLAKNPWSAQGVEFISQKLTRQITTIIGKRKKVIALDLDNTLWGGILGEDGMENLLLSNDGIGKAYYDFQQNLLKLHRSGILLVICSKNDEQLALKTIESHPYMLIKKHHLASWRINWNDKAANLASIAKQLNLGLDSFIFLDDSPHERKLLKFTHPQVEIPDLPTDPSEFAEFLAGLPSLDASSITKEDKKRNKMYKQEQTRISKKLSSDSLEKFLESLQIQVLVRKATPFTIPRIAQLTQRTNQFNLTGRRYTEDQISGLINGKNTLVLTISSKDTIGDMGLVGVIIAKKADKSLLVDTLLMSCRVLGRGIEDAALFALTKFGNKHKVSSLIGEFVETNKNGLAKDFFTSHHFTSQKDGFFIYRLNQKEIKNPSWIKLIYE